MDLIVAFAFRSKGPGSRVLPAAARWSSETEDAAAGGSGVEVLVALVVLVLRRSDDDLQRGEAKTMAKGMGRLRPGTAARGDRSYGGGRQAPVEDENVDSLQGKIADDVREMRSVVGKRKGEKSGAGDLCPRRKGPRHGGGWRNSGE